MICMRFLVLLIILFSLIACKPKQSDPLDLVISNVNLIDGTGTPLRKKLTVGIHDGKIVLIDSVAVVTVPWAEFAFFS